MLNDLLLNVKIKVFKFAIYGIYIPIFRIDYLNNCNTLKKLYLLSTINIGEFLLGTLNVKIIL